MFLRPFIYRLTRHGLVAASVVLFSSGLAAAAGAEPTNPPPAAGGAPKPAAAVVPSAPSPKSAIAPATPKPSTPKPASAVPAAKPTAAPAPVVPAAKPAAAQASAAPAAKPAAAPAAVAPAKAVIAPGKKPVAPQGHNAKAGKQKKVKHASKGSKWFPNHKKQPMAKKAALKATGAKKPVAAKASPIKAPAPKAAAAHAAPVKKPDAKLAVTPVASEVKKPEPKKPEVKKSEAPPPDVKKPEVKKAEVKTPEVKAPAGMAAKDVGTSTATGRKNPLHPLEDDEASVDPVEDDDGVSPGLLAMILVCLLAGGTGGYLIYKRRQEQGEPLNADSAHRSGVDVVFGSNLASLDPSPVRQGDESMGVATDGGEGSHQGRSHAISRQGSAQKSQASRSRKAPIRPSAESGLTPAGASQSTPTPGKDGGVSGATPSPVAVVQDVRSHNERAVGVFSTASLSQDDDRKLLRDTGVDLPAASDVEEPSPSGAAAPSSVLETVSFERFVEINCAVAAWKVRELNISMQLMETFGVSYEQWEAIHADWSSRYAYDPVLNERYHELEAVYRVKYATPGVAS